MEISMESDSWRRRQVTGLGAAEGQLTLWKGRVGQTGGRQAACKQHSWGALCAPTHTSLGSH